MTTKDNIWTRPISLGAPKPAPAPPTNTLPLFPTLALLSALMICMAPDLVRMPWWAGLLIVALLFYRGAVALGRARTLPASTQSLLLLLLVGLAGWGLVRAFETLLGRDGGTAILVVLLALKTLETRSGRDLHLLVLLGFFLTVTHFFFVQDSLTAAHALLSMLALCAVLALWEQPSAFAEVFRSQALSFDRFRPLLRSAGTLLLQALPLAAALFVLFPRPDSPLWQMPVSGSQSSSGLSDSVNPGGISSLALSDEVAFRAEFGGPVPAPSALYWRGPVMDVFDGAAWRIGPSPRVVPQVVFRSQPQPYTLTAEPSDRAWVLALDAPGSLPAGTTITQNLQVIKPTRIGARTRFKLSAVTDFQYGLNADDFWLGRNLELPVGSNPRLRELAASWLNLPPIERVKAGLNVFREGGYAYTLNPPLLSTVNGLDDFVFRSKRGFCEHFASSYAFMMRAAGIPARVITGYQGAESNGNYLIVRQANAHAWTEVWLPGQGWIRVDPTATVSPDRIEQGARAIPGARGLASGNFGLFKGLSLRLDALQNLWNTWVIGYDGDQQRQLFARLGLGEFGSAKLTLFGVLALLLAGVPMLLRRRAKVEPLLVAYELLSRRLKLPREPQEPGSAYAERAARQHPTQAAAIQALVGEYQTLRYGPEPSAEQVQAFMQKVRGFRPER
jgi:protein-glutamine gamma-glutamyltransferase